MVPHSHVFHCVWACSSSVSFEPTTRKAVLLQVELLDKSVEHNCQQAVDPLAGATTTGFVNCASTHTHASSAAANVVIVTDVHKPAKRWLGATLSSSTATPSYTLALKYGLRKPPTSFTSTAGLSAASGGIKRVVSPTSST